MYSIEAQYFLGYTSFKSHLNIINMFPCTVYPRGLSLLYIVACTSQSHIFHTRNFKENSATWYVVLAYSPCSLRNIYSYSPLLGYLVGLFEICSTISS